MLRDSLGRTLTGKYCCFLINKQDLSKADQFVWQTDKVHSNDLILNM